MAGRPGGDQRGREGRLPRARLTRDRDPAAELHHAPEEAGCLGTERVALDKVVEGDVTHRVTTDRRRELIAYRRNGGSEASAPLEDPGLHHRMLRVELPVSGGEQALDDLTVLGLTGRGRKTSESPRGVEVRHARALDEDLLHVAPRDQVGERSEVGD